MGLEAGAVFVNHCAALMVASPLQGTVSGRLGKDYRVAVREKCGIFAMGRQGRRGISSPTGGRSYLKRPSRRGVIVEARCKSRPRRGCHVDAHTESERGSEQGGILVGRCRDLRRPVLRTLQSIRPVDRRSAISRFLATRGDDLDVDISRDQCVRLGLQMRPSWL